MNIKIIHDEAYPNSFEVHVMSSEDNAYKGWVELKQAQDGSYIVAVGDYETMIFTDSIGVMPVFNEKSLGSYSFDTKCVFFSYYLQVYFGMIREINLKTWGIYETWSKNVFKYGLYDMNSNTVRTIRPYFTDDKDFTESKEHMIRILEISVHHELHYGMNKTIVTKETKKESQYVKYNGDNEAYFCKEHFIILKNGTAKYAETGVSVSDGGYDGLKKWYSTHSSNACDSHKQVNLNGETYLLFDNSTVVDTKGNLITTEGI